MFTSAVAGRRRARPLPPWAALLQRFYEPAGLAVPVLDELKGTEVPQPYRALLVHSSDMTSTLASFYGETPRLRVLTREHRNDSYKREVVLWVTEGARPIEYGVIRIHLDRLPPAARQLVLQEERPLGDILNGEAIAYLSWPQAFFRLKSDAHAGAALGLAAPWFPLRAAQCLARRLAAVAGRSDRGARPGCQSAGGRRLERIKTPQRSPQPGQARCKSPKLETSMDNLAENLTLL